MDTTYRLIDLEDRTLCGYTAASPELAKLVPGELADARIRRLGIEQTDWIDHFEKKKILRSILIEAEREPGEWRLGV